jgi:hypothetical protein
MDNICDHCGKSGAKEGCTRCYTYYCSAKCNLADFQKHSLICEPTKGKVNYPPKENICANCNRGNCKLKCGKCKIYYCSKECQRGDWKIHNSVLLSAKSEQKDIVKDTRLCEIEEAKRDLNDTVMQNLAASHGIYTLSGGEFRKFIIKDFGKFITTHDDMVNETNKLILTGEKVNGPKGIKKKKILKNISKYMKTANDFIDHINDIEEKYGLTYEKYTMESWINDIKNFNLLDHITDGYLKIKNIKLDINKGKIEGDQVDINYVISELNNRFIKSFDEVFAHIEKNKNHDYSIDMVEFDPLTTGIYAQFHFIYDSNNDYTFMRGKVFTFPNE